MSNIFKCLTISLFFQYCRTPINYLLVNLAVADILYAAFIAPRVFFNITSIHPDGVTGTVLCKLLTDGNFAWIGGASSIVTFVAIAIERYYAVMYPHGNKWKLTKAKLKVSSWQIEMVYRGFFFLNNLFIIIFNFFLASRCLIANRCLLTSTMCFILILISIFVTESKFHILDQTRTYTQAYILGFHCHAITK